MTRDVLFKKANPEITSFVSDIDGKFAKEIVFPSNRKNILKTFPIRRISYYMGRRL